MYPFYSIDPCFKKFQSCTVEAVDQPVMISVCILNKTVEVFKKMRREFFDFHEAVSKLFIIEMWDSIKVYEKIPNQKPDIPEVIPWDNVVLSGHESNCDLFPLGCIGADYNVSGTF